MIISTCDDVDKFFDKFQDPSHEIPMIALHYDALVDQRLDSEEYVVLTNYFIKKLIMKAYRLGKEHAYAGVMETLRSRK